MIQNDKWLKRQISRGMIKNGIPEKHREAYIQQGKSSNPRNVPALSYGVSSYGYDIRLSPNDFRVFKRPSLWRKFLSWARLKPLPEIDPKNFGPEFLRQVELQVDERGEYFVIPPKTYALGVSKEWFHVPENCTVVCQGKSTYARAAVTAAPTPLEAGWKGYITLEFFNNADYPARIYAHEGVVQLLFFEGEPCETPYKNGYQDQKDVVTLARV